MLPGADYFFILCWDAIFVFSNHTDIDFSEVCMSIAEDFEERSESIVFQYLRFIKDQ